MFGLSFTYRDLAGIAKKYAPADMQHALLIGRVRPGRPRYASAFGGAGERRTTG